MKRKENRMLVSDTTSYFTITSQKNVILIDDAKILREFACTHVVVLVSHQKVGKIIKLNEHQRHGLTMYSFITICVAHYHFTYDTTNKKELFLRGVMRLGLSHDKNLRKSFKKFMKFSFQKIKNDEK